MARGGSSPLGRIGVPAAPAEPPGRSYRRAIVLHGYDHDPIFGLRRRVNAATASTFLAQGEGGVGTALIEVTPKARISLTGGRDAVRQMTALAHKRAAFEIRIIGKPTIRTGNRLMLRATEDGWSLIGADGQVVFRGLGLGGRRACLEYAREQGVPAVFS